MAMEGLQIPYLVNPALLLPEKLIAGDNWLFSAILNDYSDGSWTATLTFGAGPTQISAIAIQDQTVFNWSFASTDTAKLPAQPYQFALTVTSGTETITVQTGGIVVLAPIGSATWVGNETPLQQMLRAADDSLIKLFSKQVQRTMFGGKQYEFWEIDKLWKVRNEIAARVADELANFRGNLRAARVIPVFRNM